MGQASTKHENWDNKEEAGGEQSDYPKQASAAVPGVVTGTLGIVTPRQYPGQPCNYRFVNFAAVRQSLSGTAYMSNSTLSTIDPDNYMPRLTELYSEGYRLLSFVVKPGNLTASAFPSELTSDISCQAICRKTREEECYETYTIKHEKSSMPSQAFVSGGFRIQGTNSNTDHIFKTIEEETGTGSRLVCVEVTGFGQLVPHDSTMSGNALHQQRHRNLHLMANAPTTTVNTVLGVDIFFEVPQFAGSSKYIYQCVPIQMNLATLYTGSALTFDWFPVVKGYCETGWRLVDVFLDQKSQVFVQNTSYGGQNVHIPVHGGQVTNSETIFIFEKEESRMDDKTPIYEVTVVEFGAKVKQRGGFGGMTVDVACNWEDTIASMGVEGWELVRILFTPLVDLKGVGFTSIKHERKLLLFMQREIMPPPGSPTQSDIKGDNSEKPGVETSDPGDGGADSALSDPPPPYPGILDTSSPQTDPPNES